MSTYDSYYVLHLSAVEADGCTCSSACEALRPNDAHARTSTWVSGGTADRVGHKPARACIILMSHATRHSVCFFVDSTVGVMN